ncbi:MAG: cold shock domain-containing protein [Candidatus Paceibacterota bacterium]
MAQGTIKKLMSDRNFGFIDIEGQDKDLFFHADQLQGVTYDELNEGDTVEFEVAETEKGPSASNVTRV